MARDRAGRLRPDGPVCFVGLPQDLQAGPRPPAVSKAGAPKEIAPYSAVRQITVDCAMERAETRVSPCTGRRGPGCHLLHVTSGEMQPDRTITHR